MIDGDEIMGPEWLAPNTAPKDGREVKLFDYARGPITARWSPPSKAEYCGGWLRTRSNGDILIPIAPIGWRELTEAERTAAIHEH